MTNHPNRKLESITLRKTDKGLTMNTQPKFPVGGPREPVYRFLLGHGFTMNKGNDKHWTRADGIELHIYGTGSMARITDIQGSVMADSRLDIAVIAVESLPHDHR